MTMHKRRTYHHGRDITEQIPIRGRLLQRLKRQFAVALYQNKFIKVAPNVIAMRAAPANSANRFFLMFFLC